MGNPTPKSSYRRQQKLYQTYSGPSKETQFGIKDSKDFVGISYLIVLSDELLMAHHAVSLFTNVDVTQIKLQDNQTPMKHTRLCANDIVIIKLLSLVLNSMRFHYMGKIYKQMFGADMDRFAHQSKFIL